MTQFFKGDAKELKYYNSGKAIMDNLSFQKDELFNDAYACFVLGELLHESKAAPLTYAMPVSVFREAFASIFDAFLVSGSFESYLTVFRTIFGDTVDVQFTVPAAGRLQIDITADGVVESDFVARRIVDNEYVLDNVVDDLDNQIVFQTIKGLESQYEVEQMLFELVPDGIYTEITLSLGE